MSMSVAIDNFFWNVRIIPTRIELEWRSRKAVRDPEYLKNLRKTKEEKTSKVDEKAQKKQDKETMKMAEEAASQDRDELYSDSVRNSIITMTKDDDSPIRRLRLINRACDTNKLLQFTMFYMTDERAQLMNHKQIEKEIVNGIAALYDFGKIYPDAGVSSLVAYDFECKDDYISTSKYLLSIKDILSRKNDPVFMEKLEKRKADLNKSEESEQQKETTVEEQRRSSWVKDENGIIHPIFISKDPIYLNEDGAVQKQGAGVSDELFNRLESELEFVLKDRDHRYEMDGDIVKLFVTKNGGVEEFYNIDPAIVMGMGRFGIFARVPNDQIIVPFDCKEIVEKVITNSFYILTADDVSKVLTYYFMNMSLYRYIDMSDTEKLAKLSRDELNELDIKLTFLIQKFSDSNPGKLIPRLRFKKFESVDDFELISDQLTKSPLAFSGETVSSICYGLGFKVSGKNVTQSFNNHETNIN